MESNRRTECRCANQKLSQELAPRKLEDYIPNTPARGARSSLDTVRCLINFLVLRSSWSRTVVALATGGEDEEERRSYLIASSTGRGALQIRLLGFLYFKRISLSCRS